MAERTALDEWIDATIRHQIGLIRVAGGLKNEVLRLLDATESDLRRQLERRLRLAQGLTRTSDVSRLDALLRDVVEIRGTAWSDVFRLWTTDLTALALSEPQFNTAILRTVMPVRLDLELPEAGRLRAIVSHRPFEGRTLRAWARKLRTDDVERISAQIRIGLVQGESVPQITRRIVGTTRALGADGVTQISRRDAETITRTAANGVANAARQELWRQNKTLVAMELYLATLDARTTPICRSLDGKTFPLGEGPVPPQHPRCRSVRQALPDAEVLGERPMKPVTERQLLREFTEREGLGSVTRRDQLPRGTRGFFDDFARRRTRELIGRVPARTSYQEFLERQSREFQNEVLGATRAKLFRNGLRLDRFVERTGDSLTLRELARRHGDVFKAAGLDPDDFLG